MLPVCFLVTQPRGPGAAGAPVPPLAVCVCLASSRWWSRADPPLGPGPLPSAPWDWSRWLSLCTRAALRAAPFLLFPRCTSVSFPVSETDPTALARRRGALSKRSLCRPTEVYRLHCWTICMGITPPTATACPQRRRSEPRLPPALTVPPVLRALRRRGSDL